MRISELVPWKADKGSLAARREEDDFPWFPTFRDMNRLFNEFVRDFDFAPWREGRWAGFSPTVNVSETDKEVQVTAELPGMNMEDVEISINHDILTIRGEKKEESEEKGQNFYRMERSFGSFQRSIPLPAEVVDADKAEATYKNGVLTIVLPKLPEARKPLKRIPIKTG
ncbi:MAG: Hsp20/alpha crystallin family protein [Chloroflexota bacterium]